MTEDRPSPRAVRALMAELEIQMQRGREQEAEGWLCVTIDGETGKLVNASGPFPTPHDALIEAGRSTEADKKYLEPGEKGWRYDVIPLFTPEPR